MKNEDTQRIKSPEKKTLTGSLVAKITAYLLLAVSALIGGAAAFLTIFMLEEEVYSYGDSQKGLEVLAWDLMDESAEEDARSFYFMRWPTESRKRQELLEEYCKDTNFQIEVWKQYRWVGAPEEYERILSNYTGYDTPYVYTQSFIEYEKVEQESEEEESVYVPQTPEGESNVIPLEEQMETAAAAEESEGSTLAETAAPLEVEVSYEIQLYVNPDFPVYDEYVVSYNQAFSVWNYRYIFPAVLLGCVLFAFLCFLFILCSAGHKNGQSGISPSVLTGIHFDVLTAGFGIVAFLGLICGVELSRGYDRLPLLIVFALWCAAETVWCTLYCMEFALRLKMGQWWKHTLIYAVWSFVGKGIRFLFRGLPLVVNTVLLYIGACVLCLMLELLVMLFLGPEGWILAGSLEKILFFLPMLYVALMCKKLQAGSKALADGDMKYQIDTTQLVLDFKEHAENLNRIKQGITRAVEERMKSERMKTELITNVSHDLKTPLTSIINYADLLGSAAGKESLSQEKVAEYSEVLLRQSRRLKKLLEDLVDASKATTGNMEMNMEKCQVGVLLSQAVGEYENRFWEKQLELITRQPEEPVWIMADGRRLWRVFDNLLNNICKYAQEGSRVYLTVLLGESHVEIIFRNMSKYALELTGEELEERFVRGDKSRHMEGNGLGLSIAKSLVELQSGQMEIVTDGDLFKVVLRFEIIQ